MIDLATVCRTALAMAAFACGFVACDGSAVSEGSSVADAELVEDATVDVAEVDPRDASSNADTQDQPDTPEVTACLPACPLELCGADDGCASSCAACPSDVSCGTCQLRLTVLELTRDGAGLPKVLTLGLLYVPPDGGLLPRVADVRLQVVGPATFLEVMAGDALTLAGKGLAADPNTGLPVQVLADGVLRTVVLADVDDTPIGGGLWLSWRFRLGGAFEPMDAPVVIRLVRDEPILAPPQAELAAGDPATLAPVAIWPTAPSSM